MNPWLHNTRPLRYGLIVLGGLGGVLLFVLASASGNSHFFDAHYPLLISLNAAIAVGLLLILLVLIRRVVKRYRAGVFGSRLMLRMSLSFALMGLVPGLLLYVVSVQFLAKSIESWFDVRVDGALESGLNLGQAALDSLVKELSIKGQSISLELSRTTPSQQILELSRLRETTHVQELTLLSETGQMIGSSSGSIENDGSLGNTLSSTLSSTLNSSLLPSLPTPSMLRQALVTRPFQQIEPDRVGDSAQLTIRIVVPIAPPLINLDPGQRYVQILQPVPLALSQKASAVQAVYRDYQELQLSRSGLRKIYGITLTLALILTALVSVAVALALSSRLSAPLLWLAEGTKALAQGNFRTMQPIHADDELRELTDSFNRMTEQLYEAQTRLQSQQDELTANNQFLNSLLGNLSAGVLVLDSELRLQLFNEGAVRIFERPLNQAVGQPLEQVPGLEGFAMAVRASIADHQARTSQSNAHNNPNKQSPPADNTTWQKHLELPRAFDAQSVRSILLRGSQLPGTNEGHVLVCDDITALISAQRTVAWGEVARRVAHEIKNPLTPIQLSAERLHKKLATKLEGPDLLVLERSTRTIVHQVEALKRMVNDFRDYARLPPAVLKPLCLNELVLDVLALYGVDGLELQQGQGSSQGVQVHSQGVVWNVSLAENLPKVQGDVSQLRQVIHNLLQNALDASAEHPAPCVDIRTEGLNAPNLQQLGLLGVRLVVMDNGIGFKADVLDKAFEPYVTTKTKGTGLGLAIVKKIADEHKVRIALHNRYPLQGQTQGAVVELTFPMVVVDNTAATPGTTTPLG